MWLASKNVYENIIWYKRPKLLSVGFVLLACSQVRVMTEPSNVPPLFSFQFLAQVTKGISAEVVPEPWEVTFQQPASDYLDFRKRLDTGNVSLENVIVRESEDIVVGTVKVRNIAYHKEVFVRTTSDDWLTHEDAYCTFVNNNITPATAAYVLYDTFSFRLTLPPRSHRVEFCVCFRCEGAEYWDSNCGKNYVLLKKSSGKEEELLLHKLRRNNSDNPPVENKIRCADAVYAKLDSWSEFASWNHLDNSSPYW
jgi:protein phosphatase 1 regulatory subunit 3A/B/C/D/E